MLQYTFDINNKKQYKKLGLSIHGNILTAGYLRVENILEYP